jgi:hypothetical protein
MAFAAGILPTLGTAHDWTHVDRVARRALALGDAIVRESPERAIDTEILLAGAVLHDVAHHDYATLRFESPAVLVRECVDYLKDRSYLTESPDRMAKLVRILDWFAGRPCIGMHDGMSRAAGETEPDDIELDILHDAVAIDSLGVVGLARVASRGTMPFARPRDHHNHEMDGAPTIASTLRAVAASLPTAARTAAGRATAEALRAPTTAHVAALEASAEC